MNTSKEKKNFEWKKGGTIDDKDYQPLGNVRNKGLPKIAKAIAADPERRKREREEYVAAEQQKPYPKKISAKDEELLIEESHSGLSQDIGDEKARKLINQGAKNAKIKGVERFGNK